MSIEQHVTNLELSKKLKELGMKQESIFSWMKRPNGKSFVSSAYGCDCWVELPYDNENFCSAYLASELLEMLPKEIILPAKYTEVSGSETDTYILSFDENGKPSYDHDDYELYLLCSHDETETNLRARMLIHLIEQGHVKND